jgi:hypothetical protein
MTTHVSPAAKVTSLHIEGDLLDELNALAEFRGCRIYDLVVEACENLLRLNRLNPANAAQVRTWLTGEQVATNGAGR